jgi:hypothetical protein
MTLLRDSPDDLFALCGAAADSLGIPQPAFVEKDFWVIELLRSVVRPLDLEPVNNIPCSATVRFKGGTPTGLRDLGLCGWCVGLRQCPRVGWSRLWSLLFEEHVHAVR